MRLFPHNNFEIPSYSMPSTIKSIIAHFVCFDESSYSMEPWKVREEEFLECDIVLFFNLKVYNLSQISVYKLLYWALKKHIFHVPFQISCFLFTLIMLYCIFASCLDGPCLASGQQLFFFGIYQNTFFNLLFFVIREIIDQFLR